MDVSKARLIAYSADREKEERKRDPERKAINNWVFPALRQRLRPAAKGTEGCGGSDPVSLTSHSYRQLIPIPHVLKRPYHVPELAASLGKPTREKAPS